MTDIIHTNVCDVLQSGGVTSGKASDYYDNSDNLVNQTELLCIIVWYY